MATTGHLRLIRVSMMTRTTLNSIRAMCMNTVTTSVNAVLVCGLSARSGNYPLAWKRAESMQKDNGYIESTSDDYY